MTALTPRDRRGIEVIQRLDREFTGRSGAVRKLWRQRSVAHLVDLFHELCDTLEASWLIECGAHAAEASERFIEADHRRRAVALEANPHTYATKTARVAGPRLTVLAEGIADRAGQMLLAIPSNGAEQPTPVDASFLAAVSSGDRSVVEVAVKMTTIDLLQRRFEVTGRVALWIDVEGMSREVLRGGTRTIPDNVVVAILEAETTPLWEGGGSFDEIDGLMRTYGLEPLARDSQQDGQFNIIYLRSEFRALATDSVDRYLVQATRPVPIRSRLEHALRSGRKLGLRRATAASAKEWSLRMLGVDRALRLKAVLVGRRGAESAD